MFDGPLQVLFNAWPPDSELLFCEPGNAPLFEDFYGPVAPQGCIVSKKFSKQHVLRIWFLGGPFSEKIPQPVLVAQGFKWSRCTATLMDEHALGAQLGAWREGISDSTMPLYPTRGQWLPYRWRDMEKASFSPSSAHLSGGLGFKPCDRQKLFQHKIQLLAWRDDFHAHADFPIQLVWCCKDPSFLLLLLPLESLRKL